MKQSESISNIVAALTKSALEMQNVEKNMTVGTGSNSYKGVADKDIKTMTRAMLKNGLIMLPVDYKTDTKYETWEETGNYGSKKKRDVFVELTATYRLSHVSGEWIEVVGYGHATDTSDKAAGKATTYALKYAQMYVFNLIIGTIDDTDLFHSDELEPKSSGKPSPDSSLSPVVEEKPKAKYVKGKKDIDDVVSGGSPAKSVTPTPAPEPTPPPAKQADSDPLEHMYTITNKKDVMQWFSEQVMAGNHALRERKNDMLAYIKTL